MTNLENLKIRLSQIVEANRQVKANPSVILIHLVKALYADETLTNDKVVQLCGIDRKTFYRNNKDIKTVEGLLPTWCHQDGDKNPQRGVPNVVSGVTTAGTGVPNVVSPTWCPQEKERESPPHTPSKERENTHSLRSCVRTSRAHEHTYTHEGDFSGTPPKPTYPEEYCAMPERVVVQPRQPNDFNQYATFKRRYPRRKDIKGVTNDNALMALWCDCEDEGWTGAQILQALEEAIHSESWSEKNGRFIPTAFKFLQEEQFRNFLPIGTQPRGSAPSATSTKSKERRKSVFEELGIEGL